MSDARDVVFTFSYLTWQAAAARGWFMPEDRLARVLVDHESVGRLLVSNQFRSWPRKLLRDRFTPVAEPFPADARRRLIEPVRLRRIDSPRLGAIERAYRRYGRRLGEEAERFGLENPVLITAHPFVAGFADLGWADAVTFYAYDDLAAHPAYERWWPAYQEAYSRMREAGTRVCAVSDVVLDAVAPTGPGLVVPNGIEPAEWEAPARPGWLEDDGRPLMVYVGALGARLDIGAVLRIAERFADARIMFVGPSVDPDHLRPLRDVPNVELRAAVPRAEVTGLIHAADVGLVPHVRSPLTEGMSPLKLYEYLAGGLPVAGTDLPPMRGIDPRVVLAPEGGDMVGAVDRALGLGRAEEPVRRAFVAANSWRARQDALLGVALA
jgi:glycosyltransferase involved in cell wall biosynthesis